MPDPAYEGEGFVAELLASRFRSFPHQLRARGGRNPLQGLDFQPHAALLVKIPGPLKDAILDPVADLLTDVP